MMFLIYDIFVIIPEIYLLICVSLLLIYGTFFSTANNFGFPVLNANVAGLSFQISIFFFGLVYFSTPFSLYAYNQLLVNNYFIKNIKLIITALFIFFLSFSFSYVKNERINSFEFWILTLLSLVAMLFTIQVNDLLSMYVLIEFQSLIYYILASFKRTSEFSTEAGLKYFILGAFSSILLLFGFSTLYGLTGLTNFIDFRIFFSDFYFINDNSLNLGVVLSLILINTSLLFKLTVAPFHMWAPDVYEGSFYPITLFFSILPKFTILILFLRFFTSVFYNFFYIWQPMVLLCIYFSVTIGTFGAFLQNRWKRFLAYSSISHIGFILVGLIVTDLSGNFSLIFYILTYFIVTFGIFWFILVTRCYEYPKYYYARYIKSLEGLSESNPVLSLSLSLLLFSMVGIPPLIGFFSKAFILLSCFQINIYSLSVFLIIISCVSCFYYIRIIKTIYFTKKKTQTVFYLIEKIDSFFLGFFVLLTTFLFLNLEFFSLFITHIILFLIS